MDVLISTRFYPLYALQSPKQHSSEHIIKSAGSPWPVSKVLKIYNQKENRIQEKMKCGLGDAAREGCWRPEWKGVQAC